MLPMTIERLKAETAKLSPREKLEFLQFLAGELSPEERAAALTPQQEKTLLRRRAELKSGRTRAVPAKEVKAKLARKHGLQA